MTTVDVPVLDRTKLYVGGEWIDSAGGKAIDVLNPATEQVIARVAEGTAADADKAVAAARAAFAGWSALTPNERADHLQAAAGRAPRRHSGRSSPGPRPSFLPDGCCCSR